jgi:Zn-dependent protease
MDSRTLVEGLLFYVGLVALLTFHEFGHAWMALKCGDDTAQSEGRVSLNPLVHMDLIGTVAMPLLMIFMSGSAISSFLVGWAKPVPVNLYNLRNPRMDDVLVTLAGPWMNLLLAVVIMALARVGLQFNWMGLAQFSMDTSRLSLLLCFFNLLPIPPLDGSRVARVIIGMSYETYWRISRYGFVILIIAIQIPFIRGPIGFLTDSSWKVLADWFGVTDLLTR